MKFKLILFLLFISMAPTSGQKFRFATSLGTSYMNWSQNQVSLNTSAALQFQKPGKPTQLYGHLQVIGNMQSTRIGDQNVAFRGGKGEIGVNQFTKIGLFATTSVYSLSMAKKTRTANKDFLSDEKFSLHGLRAGLGFKSNGKVKTTAQVKVFKPFLAKVSLQDWGNEQSTTLDNSIGYQASVDFRLADWSFGFDYENIRYGGTYANLKLTSAQVTYFF
jgi:hypothetical protein